MNCRARAVLPLASLLAACASSAGPAASGQAGESGGGASGATSSGGRGGGGGFGGNGASDPPPGRCVVIRTFEGVPTDTLSAVTRLSDGFALVLGIPQPQFTFVLLPEDG